MVDLIASEPFAAGLPLVRAGLRVEAVDPGQATLLVAGDAKVGKVAGMDFPEAGMMATKGAARLLWMGPGQALLLGVAPPRLKSLACMDQSDAWALARLRGADGPEVLARLVPVDLRPGSFPVGRTARTLIGHMTASVSRIDEETLEVMVMRSMAGTLVHDLQRAMLTSVR